MPTKPTGRPRGRPPGAKNRPKTIEAFVFQALESSIQPPPRSTNNGQIGVWEKLDAGERAANSAKIRAARKRPTKQTPGKPRDLTNKQWAVVQEVAASDAKSIIKTMRCAGQLPDDPRAVEALEKTLRVLRSAESAKDKSAAARLILDFTKAKPAQKSEVTIRTHEDFLDELAGEA